jgi:hypothetical protein
MIKLMNLVLISMILFSFGFFNSISSFAEEVARNNYQPTVEQKLNDLIILDTFNEEVEKIEIDNNKTPQKNKKLKFNKEKARSNSKLSNASIKLKEQLSEYNAKIIDATKKGENFINLDIKEDYPEVSKFYDQLETLKLDYKPDLNKNSKISFTGDIEANANPLLAWYEAQARIQCGYFNNPKPRTGAPKPASWHQDPEKTLLSWGYHRTANYATGREYGIYDYTRSITWNSTFCKWGSFRDHAGIDRDQWGNKTNILKEQKYWGYTPNGECNPEIHSYVWPYPEWPAYCKWWHDRN